MKRKEQQCDESLDTIRRMERQGSFEQVKQGIAPSGSSI